MKTTKYPPLTIIVAVSENQVIGKDNDLIWDLSIDLKRFKSLTSGHNMIMGRKTFESFPKPLPNRTHVVITRQKNYKVPKGILVVNSLEKAIEIFTDVIDLDPSWAEAWNKRATVYYMIGEFEKSQADINKVLELESRHFGALAGQGLVNIELKNYEKAIKSYQQAQEIYPSMQSPNIMIEKIKKLIKKQSV